MVTLIFKFVHAHENEEYQAVSLEKESQRLLSLIRTRDTKKSSNKMTSFPPSVITFKI